MLVLVQELLEVERLLLAPHLVHRPADPGFEDGQRLAFAGQRLQQVIGGRVVHLGVLDQVLFQLGNGRLILVDEIGVGGDR